MISYLAYKSARISELLCETKVNQVHSIAMSTNTHQEVVWLYIAMYKIAVVHELQALDLQIALFSTDRGHVSSVNILVRTS